MEDANEETGWKLVHGDVMRPPTTQPMLFAVSNSYFAFILLKDGSKERASRPYRTLSVGRPLRRVSPRSPVDYVGR